MTTPNDLIRYYNRLHQWLGGPPRISEDLPLGDCEAELGNDCELLPDTDVEPDYLME